jgi:hypothetical protein
LTLSEIWRSPEALGDFAAGVAGKTLLVGLLFAGVMLFLRLLYGPRGLLREKRWDEMNKEFRIRENLRARRQRRRAELAPLLEKETAAFDRYVESFYSGAPEPDRHIRLKHLHSMRVLQNAWVIAAGEAVFNDVENEPAARGKPAPDRALLLAALYHDLGRFEQLKRYNTFRDADSIDHGLLGSRLLARENFLAGESPALRRRVRGAVLLHNRLALPSRLETSFSHVLMALRDADKLDIISVMREELLPGVTPDPVTTLQLPDRPGAWNPRTLSAVLEDRPVLYADLLALNDFRLLLCSWALDLHFAAARTLLARRGIMEDILAGLPATAEMAQVRSRVRCNT